MVERQFAFLTLFAFLSAIVVGALGIMVFGWIEPGEQGMFAYMVENQSLSTQAAYNSEEEVKAKKEKREPVMILHISCHIFRHTFASRLCEKETNIKVIQQIMGHADVSTTMNIYAEVNEATTRLSIDNLALKYDELF